MPLVPSGKRDEISGYVSVFADSSQKWQSNVVISGISGPKLTKFLFDVKRSSPVLTFPSALRYSNSLWNDSAKNATFAIHPIS